MKRSVSFVALIAVVCIGGGAQAQTRVDPPQAQRPLVQALQQRVLDVVQRTLGATDEQMRQLVEVNRHYEAERKQLNQRDREARQAIRAEVLKDSAADQSRVSQMLDQLVDVQSQRLDVFTREQHDLARFLSPVQRAKYATLQEQLRKKVEQLRQQRQENTLPLGQRRRLRQLRRMGDTTS